MTQSDYMRRALELTEAGRGLTSPNPMVGAVLVREGRVLGEAFHTYDGLKHAEILALEQAGEQARGATLYINLEPCGHQGRTPPCTEAIVRAGVARVVAGMVDPNPLVAGRGFERLRQAGIEVECGVLEDECRRLNEHFVRYIQGGVFVTLKSAMTLDGRIAGPVAQAPLAGQASLPADSPVGQAPLPADFSGRFTSPESLAYVQALRHAHDALLTGIGTVLADNPLLTDRSGHRRRRPLLRVVLDSQLRLPLDSRLVQSANGDLLVVARAGAAAERARRLEQLGVEVVRIQAAAAARPAFADVLQFLRTREIASVLVEAGSQLNASALESGLVDKLVLFYAPRLVGGPDAPPMFAGRGFSSIAQAPAARISGVRQMGGDVMVEAYLRDP
jgi:diaminohydroxyphosphoribosylaminopyrimidine deaminase/5-amino-6-(5-phosphoribosylamino)uracil reductase